MISSLYAGLLALWIVWLSLRVINVRKSKRISLGDGGEAELQLAIRVQGNAIEYIPIALILLLILELNVGHIAIIHIGGIAVLMGRVLHARGLLTENLRFRILGMQFTIFTLIGLALANIFYAF